MGCSAPMMSAIDAFFAILGSAVATLVAVAGLAWWAYKRGLAAGVEKAGQDAARAKIETLERQLIDTRAELTQTRADLAAFQSRRQRP